jgi:hypothetical protein
MLAGRSGPFSRGVDRMGWSPFAAVIRMLIPRWGDIQTNAEVPNPSRKHRSLASEEDEDWDFMLRNASPETKAVNEAIAESLRLLQHNDAAHHNYSLPTPPQMQKTLARRLRDLCFEGVVRMSPEQSERFADEVISHFHFDMYVHAQDILEALEIRKDGLRTLSAEDAKALAWTVETLCLDGLTSLSEEAAWWLGLHNGHLLSLNGLTTLSTEAAQSLAQHKGNMYLNGLISLSDEAIKVLQANPKITLSEKFR